MFALSIDTPSLWGPNGFNAKHIGDDSAVWHVQRHGASFSPCLIHIVQKQGGTIRAERAKIRIRIRNRQPRMLRTGSNARRIVMIIAGTATHTYTTIMTASFDIIYR